MHDPSPTPAMLVLPLAVLCVSLGPAHLPAATRWADELSIPTAPAWVDITDGLLGDDGRGMGVAMQDVDGDGDLDIYLTKRCDWWDTNCKGRNRLFRNEGDGTFTDATRGPLAGTWKSLGASFGDIDNDGDLDLYVNNDEPGSGWLFRNDGLSGFADVTPVILRDGFGAACVAFGDIDRDGNLDVFVGHGANLYKNLGNGTFAASAIDGVYAPQSRGIAFCDVNNDGNLDLYVGRGTSLWDPPHENLMLMNKGYGAFTNWTRRERPHPELADPGETYGVAFGDIDNDGDLDLYVANFGSKNGLYRNDGQFVNMQNDPSVFVRDSRNCLFGDVDNDGDLDLYVVNYGPNKLFLNDGTGAFVEAPQGVLNDGGNGMGAAFGDVDGDGDLDLYLANDRGANKLFRNEASNFGNHWLHVDLVGVISNRFGVGARVEIVADGRRQMREVSGGSGYLSQDSFTAEFGLGAATTVDSLIIRWPSGIVQALTRAPGDDRGAGITTNQVVEVVEGPINSPPVCSDATAEISIIWPPDHRLVPVSIIGVVDPDADPVTIVVTGITQDEPLADNGSGKTCPDAILVGGFASVRAERSAKGNGRVYVVAFTAEDAWGASCDGSVRICVPHDERAGGRGWSECMDDGQTVNSLGPCTDSELIVNPSDIARRGLGVELRFLGWSGADALLEYSLQQSEDVVLAVYDVVGRRVAAIDGSYRSAGLHRASWNTSGLSQGVYFCRLRTAHTTIATPLLVLK